MAGVPIDRQDLEARQLAELQALLTLIRPANRFQTGRLTAAQAPLGVSSLREFTERFPLTTKEDLVRDITAEPPFGTNLTFPLSRYTRFHQTSGTTGHPLRWLDTPESWDAMLDGWVRVFEAAGVTARDRVLFAFTFGPFLGFWMAFDAAQRLGCLCLPAGGLNSAARLRMLLDNEATVLCCTPTYAHRLAEVAREEGLDLRRARIRRLIVAGEPGGSIPPVRARLSRLWNGARVCDHHGMTEVGPVTYECPVTPGRLHVFEQAYVAEVIAPDTGAPIEPGETGELVLTTLRRSGSPLLRYRTGDLVEPVIQPGYRQGPPCPCGSVELALDGGIIGRADDMVIVRGVNVHPGAIEGILHESGGVEEYQMEVFTAANRSELSLRIETQPDAVNPGQVARRVQQAIQTRLNLRVSVTPVPRGTLPRFEMKARRWIRTVAPPDDAQG